MPGATIYIYPSISGTITSIGNGSYCSGGTHSACNGGNHSCIDIGGTGDLYLRVSNYLLIKSVRITSALNCAPGCIDNYRRIVTCELYQNQNLGGMYIGRVAYGHVGSPVYTSTTTVNLAANTLKIGSVPADNGSCPTWYNGAHTHIEYSSPNSSWVYGGLVCNTTVSTSTYIYAMTYFW